MIEPVRFTLSRRPDAVGLRLPPRVDGRFGHSALNPQPLPPKLWDRFREFALNPQPLPPRAASRYEKVGLNPQPLPPRIYGYVVRNPQPFAPRAVEMPLSQFTAKMLGVIR
ncbi:MAG: hypothetical protein ACKV22_23150 [Bryobacteraceae bacterium]